MGNLDKKFQELVSLHNKQGGTTYHVKSGTPESKGFALSLYPDRSMVVPSKNITTSHVKDFYSKNKDLLDKPENHIGTWHDKSSGNTYMDVSTIEHDRNKAIELGKNKNQKAIFSLSEGKEIPTGGTGEPMIRLEHYSDKPYLMERGIDPSFYGTGVKGEEGRRKSLKNWSNRSYHYVAGSKPEAALGSKKHVYVSEVAPHKIYDIGADPDRLADKSKWGRTVDPTELEHNIKQAGYLGFRNTKHPSMSNVVALFHPIKPVSKNSEDTKTLKRSDMKQKEKLKKQDFAPPPPPPPAPMLNPAATAAFTAGFLGKADGECMTIKEKLQKMTDLARKCSSLKKDDKAHAPGSPEDKAHDIIEEGQPVGSAADSLGSESAASKMFQHLRSLKTKSDLRNEKNQEAGRGSVKKSSTKWKPWMDGSN